MTAIDPGGRQRIEAAFESARHRSQELGVRVVLVAFPFIVAWVTIENGVRAATTFYPLLAVLAVLMVAPYFLQRAGRFAPWQDYLGSALYVALVTGLILKRPWAQVPVPWPVYLTFGNEIYYFVIVAGAVFTFSPRVILFTGLLSALAWSAVVIWILYLPDTIGSIQNQAWETLPADEHLRLMTHPNRVHIGKWVREVVGLVLVASSLATFVYLSRGLVFRQALAERERANLSRYFSANMVEELAHTDEPLGPTRGQTVAVLFVDLVGFTAWSAERSPQAVIDMLRDFHGRMERCIFERRGTVDKYIGDAVMATFGTPQTSPDDAARALACIDDILQATAAWNRERRGRGEEELRVGIGAHYGPVVLGNIGGDQRLEFAVLGDTVNIASRLERLTRDLGVVAVVSDALLQAVPEIDRRTGPAWRKTRHAVRGHDHPLDLWIARA